MTRTILFLDIDGVINSDRSISAKKMTDHFPNSYRKNYLISKVDSEAVSMLNYVTDTSGTDICISSANRKSMPYIELVEMLRIMGVTGKIVGATPVLPGIRGNEIEQWLSLNQYDNYAIVDDSTDFLPHQLSNFVQICSETGMTQENADAIIRILKQ